MEPPLTGFSGSSNILSETYAMKNKPASTGTSPAFALHLTARNKPQPKL